MMSCNSELPDFSSASPAIYTTLAHFLAAFKRNFNFKRNIIVSLYSRLALASHSRVKPNGRLARIISLFARGFARTLRPDIISWRDSLMSRTLAIDGCHELCLLHLSDLNLVRHALIELTAGQQILVSSDLTSRCLGLIVSLDETLDVIRLLF